MQITRSSGWLHICQKMLPFLLLVIRFMARERHTTSLLGPMMKNSRTNILFCKDMYEAISTTSVALICELHISKTLRCSIESLIHSEPHTPHIFSCRQSLTKRDSMER